MSGSSSLWALPTIDLLDLALAVEQHADLAVGLAARAR